MNNSARLPPPFSSPPPRPFARCSGDSRVLCGTDTKVSVYAIDGSYTYPPSPAPSPPAPTPPATPSPTTASPTPDYWPLGCSVDNVPRGDRVRGDRGEPNGGY